MVTKTVVYGSIFYILWVLDAVLTVITVRTGAAFEGNPILKGVADSWILLVLKLIAIPVVMFLMRRCPYLERFYLDGSIVMGIVIVYCLIVMVTY